MLKCKIRRPVRIGVDPNDVYGTLFTAGDDVELSPEMAESLAAEGYVEIAPKAGRPVGGSKQAQAAATQAATAPAPPAESV